MPPILESDLSDRWSRAAAQAQQDQSARYHDHSPRSDASSPLDRLGLTPAEVRSLTQKLGPKPGWNKSILDLVALKSPRGDWRVFFALVLITPELASEWLKTNFRNRPVSDDTVAAYARDMKQDQWVPTHQGVAFNDADQLIDGQHRLLALIKCGQPRQLLVSFGWPSFIPGKQMTTMDAVDRGRTRSVGDQLKIQHGLPDGRIIASVAAELANLCSTERVRRLSVGDTLAIFHEFKDSILWVTAQRSKKPGLRSAGVLAAFALAHSSAEAHRRHVETWFASLNTGQSLKPDSPLAKLRAFLTGEDNSLITPGMNRGLALLTCHALFLEVRGLPGKSLATIEAGAAYWKSLQPDPVSRIAELFDL